MNNIIPKKIDAQGGIEAWLHSQQKKSLLRFLTCGSVDDGKSTLIGRLLHDTCQIYEDHLSVLHQDSKRHGTQGENIDLALLVDGLQSEREQGITIDVAYRYFSTEKRTFIIADTPGHEQYTRNMATGASTCDLAILLIDARKGLLDQTIRHSFISTLLGIKHFIVAINKMDLVGYHKKIFEQIKQQYIKLKQQLPNDLNVYFIPISALTGENIAKKSAKMSWYNGQTLLNLLDTIEVYNKVENQPIRFPVQYVNRPNLDFRGYAGTLNSGVIKVGQQIKVLPSGIKSTITRIVTFNGDQEDASSGDAITIVLKDNIDISRGDLLVDAQDNLTAVRSASMNIVWMADTPLAIGQSFDVKIACKKTRVYIKNIHHQIEISKLTQYPATELPLNSIGVIDVVFDEPLLLDSYQQNKVTGGMIFIDCLSNSTVGAGMIKFSLPQNSFSKIEHFSAFELEFNTLVRRYFPHWNTRNLLGQK